MTRRAILLREHQVHPTLRELGALASSALRSAVDGPDKDELRRIDSIVAYLQSRLATVDPDLLQMAILDRIASEAGAARVALEAFAAGASAQLGVVGERLDEALTAASQINLRLTKREFSSARSAVNEYRIEVEAILSSVRTTRDSLVLSAASTRRQLEQEAADLRNRIEVESAETRERLLAEAATRQAELNALVSSAKENVEQLAGTLEATAGEIRSRLADDSRSILEKLQADAEALKGRLAELANEMGGERQRVTALASEQQAQFSEAQNTRFREWTEAQQQRNDRFNTMVQEATAALNAQEAALVALQAEAERDNDKLLERLGAEFVAKASVLRAEIESQKAAVEKLVGVIGELGITSGYQKTAARAERTKHLWQGLAVVSMLGLIAMALWVFLPAIGSTISWPSFAGRTFITLTIGVLAAYSAHQGDKQQRIETQNKKLALELAALDPFIARLPQDKQDEFRLTIGGRSFGQGFGSDMAGADESPATLLHLLFRSKEGKQLLQMLGGARD